jgi:hypothetical protein
MDIDLQNHKNTPPQSVHGIFDLIRTYVAEQIAATLAALVYDKLTGAYLTNPFIQCGRESAGTTTVTFPVAYKTGTEPKVVLTSMETGVIIRLNGTPTATSFVQQGKDAGGTTQNQAFEWVSIGERA